MNLELVVNRFEWAGSAAAIGPRLADLAVRAEAIGVRTLSLMDHLFQIDRTAAADDPMLEAYTALGFVAGRTSRIRLRTLVTSPTFRHPVVLAKSVTTLDVVSNGRAELGIGAGWYEREHRGLGVQFPPLADRFEMLEETLQICRQMWSSEDGPFEGRHFRLATTSCDPQPISQPRPRILVGGGGERKTLRLVAQYADAANFSGTHADIRHKRDVLRRHCDDLGRDPGEIRITVGSTNLPTQPDAVVHHAEELARLGVDALVLGTVGNDPAGWLESRFGTLTSRLAEIEVS